MLCVRYTGAPNKNIGDAFLLVWTLNQADIADHLDAGFAASEAEAIDTLETQLMDNALYACMKIVVDIEFANTGGLLSKYTNHPKIRQRFPNGFKVQMGFGLHAGWAIEGTPVCAGTTPPRAQTCCAAHAAFKLPLVAASHGVWGGGFRSRSSPRRCRHNRLTVQD